MTEPTTLQQLGRELDWHEEVFWTSLMGAAPLGAASIYGRGGQELGPPEAEAKAPPLRVRGADGDVIPPEPDGLVDTPEHTAESMASAEQARARLWRKLHYGPAEGSKGYKGKMTFNRDVAELAAPSGPWRTGNKGVGVDAEGDGLLPSDPLAEGGPVARAARAAASVDWPERHEPSGGVRVRRLGETESRVLQVINGRREPGRYVATCSECGEQTVIPRRPRASWTCGATCRKRRNRRLAQQVTLSRFPIVEETIT